MPQRTKFKIAVYAVLFVIAVTLLVWLTLFLSAQSRDYGRLADMRLAQAEMADYFLQFNTFEVAECSVGSLLNFCQGRDGVAANLANLADPVNKGEFQYLLADASADNFRIDFSLEAGAGGLPAGSYSITKGGFGRTAEQ